LVCGNWGIESNFFVPVECDLLVKSL
jgi:hypothetical protein